MTAFYPASPGFKEALGTSQLAADAIAPRASTLRDRVLAELTRAPATADEVAWRLRESILSIRPRLTELKALGLVEQTGVRRRNASGLLAAEYRVRAQKAEAAA